MQEIIEIQDDANNGQWTPFVGDEISDLLRSKGFANSNGALTETGQRILDETIRIMESCGNPNSPANNDTGLVIGYVQSGKTLSFTSLAALARDNNYQIVIVIAGISTPLFTQSTERLRRDLRLDTRADRKWILLPNPTPQHQEDRDTIERALAQWANPTFPNDRCRTILITVMKNGNHLRNLADVLNGLQLDAVPTLIIDDESDQASLNTRARRAAQQGRDIESLTEDQVSTIYRRITSLRAIFPHQTFLQYTATPQANLFINIMDRLSPNFIKLLSPGDDYTGGIQFFRENPNLIEEIPLADIPTANNPVYEPPESLLRALRIFYLGVVAGELAGRHGNRSMLIHPSRLQGDHRRFFRWVNNIRDSWTRLLESNEDNEKEALLAEFREAYDDLRSTVDDLLPFEDLTNHNLINAIQYTPIVEVNARQGSTPQINWRDEYSWILVGGQSMDRGFTVEGLTVTYMPRNLGVGNVDTIQQRARFFGYKRSYLNYCRVFLDQPAIDAYDSIIENEEDVRERLVEFDVDNRHLNEWDREVVLDQMLNLTRRNILYDDLDRDRFGNDWFRIRAPHDTDNLIVSNHDALMEFLRPKMAMFTESQGHPNRSDEQRHLVARISMRECLESLLNKMKFTRESDSATYSSLRGILKRYLNENPDEECLIYLMSARSLNDWTIRNRRLNRNDEIQQLFQGEQPTRDGQFQKGEVYPGDRNIKSDNILSIQIHRLHLRDSDGNDIFDENGSLKYTNVPTLAIWIPEHIGVDIIRQA